MCAALFSSLAPVRAACRVRAGGVSLFFLSCNVGSRCVMHRSQSSSCCRHLLLQLILLLLPCCTSLQHVLAGCNSVLDLLECNRGSNYNTYRESITISYMLTQQGMFHERGTVKNEITNLLDFEKKCAVLVGRAQR